MKYLLAIAFVFSSLALWATQDEGKLSSGPKVGDILPGPFDCFNVNGKTGKGRQHCLVCEYGLGPVVMIFAKEPEEGKDGPLTALLAKLDDLVFREVEKSYLGSFVVFLSPAAKSSANQPKTEDPDELVKEAKARDDLHARLGARAEKMKGLVVACLPEPPVPFKGKDKDGKKAKGYNLNPKAEVTVIFYNRHKVQANFAYADGELNEEQVERIVKTVQSALTKTKDAPKKGTGGFPRFPFSVRATPRER